MNTPVNHKTQKHIKYLLDKVSKDLKLEFNLNLTPKDCYIKDLDARLKKRQDTQRLSEIIRNEGDSQKVIKALKDLHFVNNLLIFQAIKERKDPDILKAFLNSSKKDIDSELISIFTSDGYGDLRKACCESGYILSDNIQNKISDEQLFYYVRNLMKDESTLDKINQEMTGKNKMLISANSRIRLLKIDSQIITNLIINGIEPPIEVLKEFTKQDNLKFLELYMHVKSQRMRNKEIKKLSDITNRAKNSKHVRMDEFSKRVTSEDFLKYNIYHELIKKGRDAKAFPEDFLIYLLETGNDFFNVFLENICINDISLLHFPPYGNTIGHKFWNAVIENQSKFVGNNKYAELVKAVEWEKKGREEFDPC